MLGLGEALCVCAGAELEPAAPPESGRRKPAKGKRQTGAVPEPAAGGPVKEVNVIGKRLDEALDEGFPGDDADGLRAGFEDGGDAGGPGRVGVRGRTAHPAQVAGQLAL